MLEVNKRIPDEVTGAARENDGLVLHTRRGMLRLEPVRDDIVRVRYTRREVFAQHYGVGVLPHGAFAGWNWEETPEEVVLSTEKLMLRVQKASSAIVYTRKNGGRLLAENARLPRELTEFASYKTVVDETTELETVETPDGVKQVIKNGGKVFDKNLYHTRLHLEFAEDERIYGLGQAEEGTLNLRGTAQYLHQANRKIAVPMLVSSKLYGLLFATGSPAIFRDDAYGTWFYTEADEEMDYYFMAGESLDDVISCSRHLTGKAAMLPRWAYGFVQSQERYETQEEVLRMAAEHRRRGIGLDCIVLDWCSWVGNEWGQKSFDPGRFPNPKAMTDTLHGQDVHFMISVWPNMNKGTANNEEFAAHGLLLPASDIYDAYSEEGRKLYWKQANEGLFQYGVDAWWCDSSEPFTPEWSRPEKPGPEDMYWEFTDTAAQFVPAEVSNAYGLFHARAMYEGQRETSPEKRLMNLTRNGYTGQQRYGTVLWSGDTEATWDTMKKQIAAGLNFCASGLPYWTLDIGAFFVKRGVQWFWDGDYDEGLDDLGYRELFTRWFQLGAFLPVFRSHGTDVRREMWLFGEPFYNALLAANRLRYRLLPYIYSLAGDVWKNDSTMLRLLAFDFPHDPTAMDVKDQFMLGKALLVCPVTEPMYYGVHSKPITNVPRSRRVYLPAGADWYDFYTEEKYAGGQWITAEAPLEKIPLFVKAGSILPMAEPKGSAAETLAGPVELKVYPGQDGLLEYYEDAGDGYGYEQGEYTVTRAEWNDAAGVLTLPEGTEDKFTVTVVEK